MDCMQCGEPDMVLYEGEHDEVEDYYEPDMYECPECGHAEVM